MSTGDPGDVPAQACESGIHMDIFLHCSLIPALMIIASLSFLQWRRARGATDQRPGPIGQLSMVVPLDVIGSLRNRWSYGFAFGAVSSGVMLLFSQEYLLFPLPSWARAIVYLVGALEVGVAYYPFFACLSTPFRLVGAVLGILYSLTWTVLSVWDMVICPSGSVLGKFQKPILQWPSVLCLVFLLGRFTYMLIKAVRSDPVLQDHEDLEPMLVDHQVKYVQALLRRRSTTEEESVPQGGAMKWFERHIYKWDPNFKFPNRMIGTSIICFIGLYMMTVADYSMSDYTFDQLDRLVDSLSALAATCNTTSCNTTNFQLADMVLQLADFSRVARDVWFFTTIFACLTSVTYTFHVLVCYRKHMKRLWAGQKSFIPERFHNPSPAGSVAAITRYSGWQIAFTMWGYMIVHFVQFVLGLLVAYGLVLPIQQGRGLTVLYRLGIILMTVSVVIGLIALQVVLVQVFFLQEKISPTDKRKPLAIKDRNAFHNFTYFFFFYNVAVGLGNCVMRLVVSGVLGTWLVSRIDRTIVQRGYEVLDPGYQTWIGMIFADHYHSNPVMISFCHLLSKRLERGGLSPFQFSPPARVRRLRIRQRWRLLYTLQRNPELIQLRRPGPPSRRPSPDTPARDRPARDRTTRDRPVRMVGCALGSPGNGWSGPEEEVIYEADA